MSLTIEKNLKVAMRDGVLLASDVYRPAGDGRYPVVMLRLPYNKEQPVLLFLAGDILRVAQAGYAVVVQDCRGTWASEGEFSPYFQEAEDGADAIAWAAAQAWSTGVVGMMGASYYGATQWPQAWRRRHSRPSRPLSRPTSTTKNGPIKVAHSSWVSCCSGRV